MVKLTNKHRLPAAWAAGEFVGPSRGLLVAREVNLMRQPKIGSPAFPVVLALLITMSVGLRPAFGVTSDQEKSLRGIRHVVLVLNRQVPTEVIDYQVGESSLRTSVLLRLRTIGLSVEERKQPISTTDPTAIIVVTVHLLKISEAQYVASLQTDVAQTVKLTRDLSMEALAVTWHTAHFGAVPYRTLGQEIKNLLDAQMDAFASDFLASNPSLH